MRRRNITSGVATIYFIISILLISAAAFFILKSKEVNNFINNLEKTMIDNGSLSKKNLNATQTSPTPATSVTPKKTNTPTAQPKKNSNSYTNSPTNYPIYNYNPSVTIYKLPTPIPTITPTSAQDKKGKPSNGGNPPYVGG